METVCNIYRPYFAKVMFLQVCVCPQEGHAWQGCVHGGWHAWQRGGACVAGGHVWQGACMVLGTCMAGNMHGRGHAWQGACMARVMGGVHGMHTPHDTTRYGRSMRGRYASYWNVFLLLYLLDTLILHIVGFEFPRGAPTPNYGHFDLSLSHIFPENCIKMQQISQDTSLSPLRSISVLHVFFPDIIIFTVHNKLVKIWNIRPCHTLDPSLFYMFLQMF